MGINRTMSAGTGLKVYRNLLKSDVLLKVLIISGLLNSFVNRPEVDWLTILEILMVNECFFHFHFNNAQECLHHGKHQPESYYDHGIVLSPIHREQNV